MKKVEDFLNRIIKEKEIRETQVDRFHTKNLSLEEFSLLMDKIMTKYNSREYVDRWIKRGFEPPESLLYFLYECAKKYGREASEEEWNSFGNDFTAYLIVYKGYIFNLMIGQGTCLFAKKL